MQEKLIHSPKTRQKSPTLSFSLSLVFTGLGQLYNGQPAQAITYIIARTIMITIPTVYSYLFWNNNSLINVVMVGVILSMAITFLSPMHAFKAAQKRQELWKTGSYNLKHYSLFIIINIVLTGISVFIFLNSFTFVKISKSSPPLFKAGDIVLIHKMQPNERIGRATMYMDNSGDILRVRLLEEEKIYIRKSDIIINNIKQDLSIPHEQMLEEMEVTNYDIFLCRAGKYFFPIIVSLSHEKFIATTGKSEVLLLSDDRRDRFIHKKLKVKNLRNRVEGIVFREEISPSLPVTTLFK